MVTLRAYSNPAEAALVKSLLDDHNILCSLADENASLYGGTPLAMPVRILVGEDQVEAAIRVLNSTAGQVADFDLPPEGGRHLSKLFPAKNNPWEILALAFLLLLPGVALLLQKHVLVLTALGGRRITRNTTTVFSPAAAHLFGAFVLAVVALLTISFFCARRAIMRDQTTTEADPRPC